MAKAWYRGVSGVARKITKPHRGVDGVARKVVAGYRGVSGVAREFFHQYFKWATHEPVSDESALEALDDYSVGYDESGELVFTITTTNSGVVTSYIHRPRIELWFYDYPDGGIEGLDISITVEMDDLPAYNRFYIMAMDKDNGYAHTGKLEISTAGTYTFTVPSPANLLALRLEDGRSGTNSSSVTVTEMTIGNYKVI